MLWIHWGNGLESCVMWLLTNAGNQWGMQKAKCLEVCGGRGGGWGVVVMI